jgi:hypothetical protein
MKQQNLILLFAIIFINYCNSQSINKYLSNGIEKEMIVVPIDFNFGKNIELLGTVKSGDPTFLKIADYKTQLDRICKRADTIGGNIVMITKFDNLKLTERYKLKASVYKVSDIEKFKDSLFNKNIEKKSSEIILYRPNYTYSLNDLYNFTVIVNNQEYLMRRNSKHIIKIDNQANVEIMIKGSEDKLNFDFELGNNYYFRCLAYFPNSNSTSIPNSISIPIGGYIPKIDLVKENGKGEIESKMINIR